MQRLVFLLALSAGLLAAPASRRRPAQGVPDGVNYEPDVEYSNPDGQHLMVDLARPSKGDGPFPAVLWIHGGGFRAGNRHGYDGLCMRLAQQGYVAATVEYRLAPKYQFPAAVHDCKAAMRWLAPTPPSITSTRRIGVTGSSAGGHLALFLGVTGDVKKFEGDGGNPEQSSKPACVVSFYGPSDFTKSYGHSKDAAEVLPLFLGGDLEKAHRRHIEASPLYWVTPDARADPVHPRHQGRLRRLRTGGMDGGQIEGGRRGGGAAHHRGGRPRLPGAGRGEGGTGDDRVL